MSETLSTLIAELVMGLDCIEVSAKSLMRPLYVCDAVGQV